MGKGGNRAIFCSFGDKAHSQKIEFFSCLNIERKMPACVAKLGSKTQGWGYLLVIIPVNSKRKTEGGVDVKCKNHRPIPFIF